MSKQNPPRAALTPDEIKSVSPVLEKYTREKIVGDLWRRTNLSARDRSIVTLAALIARNQTIGMLYYFNAALDNGVKAGEISEIVAHMAFYAGWSNSYSAIAILKDIFAQRGIGANQLPEVAPTLISIKEAIPDEDIRVGFIQKNVRPVAPGLAQYTDELLYHEVWRRPGLVPRDRNLVTISALIASGQTAFLGFYLNRAVAKGITQEQISEVITHLAFYSGWPTVLTSVAVVKDFFEKK